MKLQIGNTQVKHPGPLQFSDIATSLATTCPHKTLYDD